jgi:hypothetical protein
MKNKHGYDHSEAVKADTYAVYRLGFYDGVHGADYEKGGSGRYREGWHDGRQQLEWQKEGEGYCAGWHSDRQLEDLPEYKRSDQSFVRGWHRGVAARSAAP